MRLGSVRKGAILVRCIAHCPCCCMLWAPPTARYLLSAYAATSDTAQLYNVWIPNIKLKLITLGILLTRFGAAVSWQAQPATDRFVRPLHLASASQAHSTHDIKSYHHVVNDDL